MKIISKLRAKLAALTLYKIQFKSYGCKSLIYSPLRIDGKRNIDIGNNVLVQSQTWLAAMPLTDCENPILKIGNGSVIGNFNHIYATKKIIIEDKVLTADKVYISDNLHGYENIEIPILEQAVKQINTVTIGEGSWLGENVCVIGANIGKHCVIGANSVVTKSIPDFCVAVGAPAKIIKKYNFETKTWEKIQQ